MKQNIILLFSLCIFLNSCAGIMNEPWVKTTVRTTKPSTIIFGHDTLKTVNNKVKLKLLRKNEPIEIISLTDNMVKNVKVSPRNSFDYYSNIFYNFGIGLIVDKDNPKRYSYPVRVYINSSDTLSRYYNYRLDDKKGKLRLHVSLPHINSFLLKPENESPKSNTGFWGASIGMDYFHRNNQYISFSASATTDFFVPVPAPVHYGDTYELMSSTYLSVANNHQIKRFSIGYGLAYGKNTWDLRLIDRFDPPPPTRDPIQKSTYALGPILSSHIQAGHSFNIGVVYRPTFFRFNTQEKLKYEHLISLDLGWKIPLKKTH